MFRTARSNKVRAGLAIAAAAASVGIVGNSPSGANAATSSVVLAKNILLQVGPDNNGYLGANDKPGDWLMEVGRRSPIALRVNVVRSTFTLRGRQHTCLTVVTKKGLRVGVAGTTPATSWPVLIAPSSPQSALRTCIDIPGASGNTFNWVLSTVDWVGANREIFFPGLNEFATTGDPDENTASY